MVGVWVWVDPAAPQPEQSHRLLYDCVRSRVEIALKNGPLSGEKHKEKNKKLKNNYSRFFLKVFIACEFSLLV